MKKVDRKYQVVPFWSWNGKLKKDKLFEQIDWMNQNSVGGFFMHARSGLTTEYLGDEWFDLINACTEKANELDMYAYVYDENGWPSGFAGGKLLSDKENLDRYLTYTIGVFDENADIAFSLDNKPAKTKSGDNCINIFIKTSSTSVDILNPKVVDKFIYETHKKYKEKDKYGIKGFFTDEPQFCFKAQPFTYELREYFKNNYKEDVFDRIYLLFVKKEGYRDYRYKYWKAMQSLMLNNYAKKIYDFCDENGYKLTGHYFEERKIGKQLLGCAGVMPFYEYEHIPGIDYLGKVFDKETYSGIKELKTLLVNDLSPKQVSSVAAQLGKKQVLTETGGMCGWNFSPKELKKLLEFQFVNGVNLICLHLFPYTEFGQRKRDYPLHFSEINPWVKKNFKQFNDYFAVLSSLLAESEEVVDVGVLHPLRSAYFDYDRRQEENGFGVKEIDDEFENLLNILGDNQIHYHLIDETILQKYGSVRADKLKVGAYEYSYLILPYMLTMDRETEKFLNTYCKNGGKILLYKNKPSYLEGNEFCYDYLRSNITFDDIKKANDYILYNGANIRTSVRIDNEGNKFIYIVNLGKDKIVEFSSEKFSSFKEYDILTDAYKDLPVKFNLEEGQSKILYYDDKTVDVQDELLDLTIEGLYSVGSKVTNYMPLDFIKYSLDGKSYSENRYCMDVFDELLSKRYKGELYLQYGFNVKEIPSKIGVAFDDMNVLEVYLNGNKLSGIHKSDLYNETYVCDITNYVIKGENKITFKINYYQNDSVYHTFFGDGETESLNNCLVYQTTVEAICLFGDFGVYGRTENGFNKDIIKGKDFYIGKQSAKINNLIRNGYPFFRGDICLKQTINLDKTNYRLKIDNNFHLIEVKVNGKEVGLMMFSKYLDLSECLKVGENSIELVLTVGNRNLLGESHYVKEEAYLTTPGLFERIGAWKNGESPTFTKYYNLVNDLFAR